MLKFNMASCAMAYLLVHGLYAILHMSNHYSIAIFALIVFVTVLITVTASAAIVLIAFATEHGIHLPCLRNVFAGASL